MRVWFVLSEMWEDCTGIYGDPPEAPEPACLCLIVVAETRGRAKYLAIKSDRGLKRYTPADWPLFAVRHIGEAEGPARVLDSGASEPWWPKCPEISHPVRKPYDPGFSQRDVAILGGDPGL